MSAKFPRFAWERQLASDSRIRGSTHHVLLTLGVHLDGRSAETRISNAKLHQEAGVSERTVTSAIAAAIELGYLERLEVGRFHRGGARESRYRIRLSDPPNLPADRPLSDPPNLPADELSASKVEVVSQQSRPNRSLYSSSQKVITTTTKEAEELLDETTRPIFEALDDVAQTQFGRRLIPTSDLIGTIDRLRAWPPEQLAATRELWTGWDQVANPSAILTYRLAMIADRPVTAPVIDSRPWSDEPCDHGTPGGCGWCALCRLNAADPDGVICQQCAVAVSA